MMRPLHHTILVALFLVGCQSIVDLERFEMEIETSPESDGSDDVSTDSEIDTADDEETSADTNLDSDNDTGTLTEKNTDTETETILDTETDTGTDSNTGGDYWQDGACLGSGAISSQECGPIGFAGCCNNGKVVWCDADKLYCLDCSVNSMQCGWKDNFYTCGMSNPVDPSGVVPYDCPSSLDGGV